MKISIIRLFVCRLFMLLLILIILVDVLCFSVMGIGCGCMLVMIDKFEWYRFVVFILISILLGLGGLRLSFLIFSGWFIVNG